MDVTRRTLARVLAGTAAAAAAAAQQPSSSPSSAGDFSKAVHEELANYAQQLAKVKVPMATEPAFHFKA